MSPNGEIASPRPHISLGGASVSIGTTHQGGSARSYFCEKGLGDGVSEAKQAALSRLGLRKFRYARDNQIRGWPREQSCGATTRADFSPRRFYDCQNKCSCLNGMSVLLPRADLVGPVRHVRFVPKPKVARLFDHLAGAGEQRRRDSKIEGLGGFEIDDQFEFGRRLQRKIGKRNAF
jgi:hypothetical protein